MWLSFFVVASVGLVSLRRLHQAVGDKTVASVQQVAADKGENLTHSNTTVIQKARQSNLKANDVKQLLNPKLDEVDKKHIENAYSTLQRNEISAQPDNVGSIEGIYLNIR
jgi:hypothetical protein